MIQLCMFLHILLVSDIQIYQQEDRWSYQSLRIEVMTHRVRVDGHQSPLR